MWDLGLCFLLLLYFSTLLFPLKVLHYYYYYYYYYILILQIERGSVRDRVWNGDDEFDEFEYE